MKSQILIILSLTVLTSKAQVHFGINAGANMSNIITKLNGTKDDAIKSGPGYIITGDVNIPISDNLLFQTGLQFESIHNKVNTESTASGGGFTVKETFDAKAHFSYFNIPAKIFYKSPLGSRVFLIGAGPFLGIGIGGKSSSTDVTETTVGSNTTRSVYNYESKIKYGSADTAIKRTNFGVGLNVSYVLTNNISFSAYSNIGLSNISNADKQNSKTIAYGLTMGYTFGNKED